ncbi:MAG: valine--tRNA ligase [Mycoplasmataceae bacterium]|nr:valine--tRNA ligase [Mycoplasmataceae bacterium]
MPKVPIYDHKFVEQDLYDFWKKHLFFEPISKNNKRKNYAIILPPPNITGRLHLGHAWDGALQDTIIRYKKLQGYRTIWIPGTDHAGIATQTKFEKILKENGTDRNTLSDEQFLQQLSEWAKQQADYIHKQWAKLGFALSYKNEVYSLDEHVSKLVIKTFKDLYEQQLIYRDFKLVNWDVSLKTAISDIEVVHRENITKLYYFKYMVENSREFIEVATTRPETMFVDVAVFVNPKDKRYRKYINKTVINPINNQPLKVYGDNYVEMKFGTGAMKCTPAHDFNDYQLAIKHNIKNYYSVMNEDGTLNEKARSTNNTYIGVDRLIARDAIVKEMQENNLIVKIEEHKNEIGYSERSGEIVEPLLSKQWFIKMLPLAKQTIQMIAKQKPRFIPPRFKNTMDKWLINVQDWCITRQLLWGHRVPVWYKDDKIIVGQPPKNGDGWIQDKDVLDTWFSSGLWPIALTSQHGLEDFYPIDMLVTGYDILFFWIARMFFQCGYISRQIPLKNIFFHGLVRDESNRKMSKSLNNGIDPMKVIDEYGADALRMFLVSTVTVGEDLKYSEEKIKYRWSFINKLWNAHSFLKQFNTGYAKNTTKFNLINRWIIQRFNDTIRQLTINMDKYNFVMAHKYLENFIWQDFCNHYLEFIKPLLKQKQSYDETIYVARLIFKQILIMLHPFAPFVSDFLYRSLYKEHISIMLETWPKIIDLKNDKYIKVLMQTFNNIYDFIRELRIKYAIKQTNQIVVNLITNDHVVLHEINDVLQLFNIKIDKISNKRINKTANVVVIGKQMVEYIDNFIDANIQLEKVKSELDRLENEIQRSQKILGNKQFLQKAPKNKILQEQEKYHQYQTQYQKNLTIYKNLLSKK